MFQKEVKNEKTDTCQLSKLFKSEEDMIKFDSNNCLIYGDKSDFINEDIFFKQKETIDPYYLNKRKSSTDLNLTEKNIHEFLNNDLIKALDYDDFMDPEENCENSDSTSSNAYISGSSDYTLKQNSPELNSKVIKNEKEININLNKDNFTNKNNSNDVNNKNSDINNNNENNNININNINNNNIKDNEKEKDEMIDKNIKDKIEILNDPLFTPIFIPNEMNNNKIKEMKIKEEEKIEKKKEKKNNSLKNKFDDDVEPIIMMTMPNMEEKTKLPLEIRVGDWICLYCNNLNFSFRIKCNRCGLLRKSSTHLLKKKYYNNKYQYLGNNNNFNNDNFSINYNNNNYDNYELNYNNYYNNNNNM